MAKKLIERVFGRHVVSLLFEPRDVWLGVYWNVERTRDSGERSLYVYLCVVPCLPLRLRIDLPRGPRGVPWRNVSGWMLFEHEGQRFTVRIDSLTTPGVGWAVLDRDLNELATGVADNTKAAWEAAKDDLERRVRGVS